MTDWSHQQWAFLTSLVHTMPTKTSVLKTGTVEVLKVDGNKKLIVATMMNNESMKRRKCNLRHRFVKKTPLGLFPVQVNQRSLSLKTWFLVDVERMAFNERSPVKISATHEIPCTYAKTFSVKANVNRYFSLSRLISIFEIKQPCYVS